MNDDLNQYVPSVLNPRAVRRSDWDNTLTQHSVISRCSLSLKRNGPLKCLKKKIQNICNKENKCSIPNVNYNIPSNDQSTPKAKSKSIRKSTSLLGSLGLSAVEDIPECVPAQDVRSSPFSLGSALLEQDTALVPPGSVSLHVYEENLSENTDLLYSQHSSETERVDYTESDVVSVSFGVKDCSNINLGAKNANIKNVSLNHKSGGLEVECECEVPPSADVSLHSDTSSEDGMDLPMDATGPLKRSAVTVNLEIKNKRVRAPPSPGDRVLILKTDSIEKFTHIIVQPSNCNLVKRRIARADDDDHDATTTTTKQHKHVNRKPREPAQTRILSYFKPNGVLDGGRSRPISEWGDRDAPRDMSKSSYQNAKVRKGSLSPATVRPPSGRRDTKDIKVSSAGPRRTCPARADAVKPTDSLQFALPQKPKAKAKGGCRPVPSYKIVAGTQFAVDAFSYGDIPYVKVYFLTHFHSDHYAGLKRSFDKTLFCSKITADLCISRLGVNPKVIQVLNLNETLRVDGVEVTAVDANHCPGAIMLVFSLASGATALHTGDFRAAPAMESYPVFWNKAIDTVYLDTTYCNPRYDFPTQDHSLEMALYMLRHKKAAVEKAGRKFASVLIVCGTYTIGKEKFFLGLARRIGCNVWACPEKDRVLQLAEGRSYGQLPPAQCQLHVVPMRDITVEKLRAYLEGLQGAFAEVVAFKPSGWETGKNTTEAGLVTIHGIPYSEHSSFSEMIRFVNFLQPRVVIPTVDIGGGVASVQKYFPCPLLDKSDDLTQTKMTDYLSLHGDQPLCTKA